jgi:hypothetical protein
MESVLQTQPGRHMMWSNKFYKPPGLYSISLDTQTLCLLNAKPVLWALCRLSLRVCRHRVVTETIASWLESYWIVFIILPVFICRWEIQMFWVHNKFFCLMLYVIWRSVTPYHTKDSGQESPINEIKHVNKKIIRVIIWQYSTINCTEFKKSRFIISRHRSWQVNTPFNI